MNTSTTDMLDDRPTLLAAAGHTNGTDLRHSAAPPAGDDEVQGEELDEDEDALDEDDEDADADDADEDDEDADEDDEDAEEDDEDEDEDDEDADEEDDTEKEA